MRHLFRFGLHELTSRTGKTDSASSQDGTYEKDAELGPVVPTPGMKTNLEPVERVPWYYPSEIKLLPRRFMGVLLHGSRQDIHELQRGKTAADRDHLAAVHAQAKQYDNEVEHLYSVRSLFLRLVTSSHSARSSFRS